MMRWWLPALALMLVACSGNPKKATPPSAQQVPATQEPKRSPYAPAQEDPSKRGNYTAGGLYAPDIKDSAPADLPNVELIPEPVVRDEPRSRYGNRSRYSVLGKSYHVLDSAEGYVERGTASYYGKKFHGRRTSSMEVYDMYTFSAAHKTLPLPSYARVTNLGNGKSVVVRVNDRGPFHAGRIIDLSYAAAVKLGLHRSGTAKVEVRALTPGENARESDQAVAGLTPPPAPVPAAADALPAGVRIATGKPQPAPPSAIDRLVAVLPIAGARAGEPQPVVANLARTPAGTGLSSTATPQAATLAPPEHGHDERVVLQVGAFTTRDNAERALAILLDAGIGDARLQDVQTDGRTLWRLRVGPVDASATTELGSRIEGLGFGQPQRVRE